MHILYAHINKYTDIICIKINIKAMEMAGISEHISKESEKKKRVPGKRDERSWGKKKGQKRTNVVFVITWKQKEIISRIKRFSLGNSSSFGTLYRLQFCQTFKIY